MHSRSKPHSQKKFTSCPQPVSSAGSLACRADSAQTALLVVCLLQCEQLLFSILLPHLLHSRL